MFLSQFKWFLLAFFQHYLEIALGSKFSIDNYEDFKFAYFLGKFFLAFLFFIYYDIYLIFNFYNLSLIFCNQAI
jgi:hypothetical protein